MPIAPTVPPEASAVIFIEKRGRSDAMATPSALRVTLACISDVSNFRPDTLAANPVQSTRSTPPSSGLVKSR